MGINLEIEVCCCCLFIYMFTSCLLLTFQHSKSQSRGRRSNRRDVYRKDESWGGRRDRNRDRERDRSPVYTGQCVCEICFQCAYYGNQFDWLLLMCSPVGVDRSNLIGHEYIHMILLIF